MDRTLEILLVLVMVGAVLAFGAVQPIAYSLVEMAIFLALLLLLCRQASKGTINLPLPLWPTLFVFLVIVQLIPLPVNLVESISPPRILASAAGTVISPGDAWASLSTYPHDTLLGLLKFVAYLGAFVLAAHFFNSSARRSLLISSLIGLGCFEALYGIFQYLTHTEKIFTYQKVHYLGMATGTYINHNHFAGLLGLTLPFVATRLFYTYQTEVESRNRRRSGNLKKAKGSAVSRVIFLFFVLLIMVLGVIFSYSRGGILSVFLSLVFIALLAAFRTKQKVWLLGGCMLLLGALAYGAWIGLDPVLARFEQMREPGFTQTEGRVNIWKAASRMIRDYPVAGTGLGTFGVTFRRYQNSGVEMYVDHAHNDYLQLLCEVGPIGVLLLFGPILYLLSRMVASLLSDERRFRRSVTLGCIGSTLALLLHSFIDFNLQIPANALVFAVVLGIGYKAACVESRNEGVTSQPPPAGSVPPGS